MVKFEAGGAVELRAPKRECYFCRGRGKITVRNPHLESFERSCPRCGGRGWMWADEESVPCTGECRDCVFREDCWYWEGRRG